MEYPHSDWVAREYGGVPVANLIEIFKLEKEFHARILSTEIAEDRKRQYHELYERVHLLKQRDDRQFSDRNAAERLVLTFRRELENKSILDVGCGNGWFLTTLAKLYPHGELWGLDTSSIQTNDANRAFHFVQQDVVDFTLPRQFDAVFSHQVLEHIAPADSAAHLGSIRAALISGGTFIVCLPNRFWGPQDITRIIDNTFRGRVPAQGSHLNESSYTEMAGVLEANGFRNARTLIPFGAFLPFARNIRIKPWINQALERHAWLRGLANLIAVHKRPLFKNPIMLVCERAD